MKDRVSKALLALFGQSINELQNALQKQTVGDLFALDSETRRQQNLARVNTIYNRIDKLFAQYSAAETKRQYKLGVDIAAETLRIADKTASLDSKTLGIFVKEMLDDFTRGTNGGRKMFGTFFVFSKQGVLRENEMTELMAKGWIKHGSGREGMREIAKALRAKLDSSPMTKLKPDEVDALTVAALDQYRKRGVPPQFLKSFENMIREERFLRIINKNGDPMHFRVNHYAELVARTRTGNAQVHGTIEQANAYGVTEFQVTSHNTETEICRPHEGKVYTTDPNNTRFEYMTPERRPLYHILCKHRLLPRAFTRAKLDQMPEVRAAPGTAKTPEQIAAARRDFSEPRPHAFSGPIRGDMDSPHFAEAFRHRVLDIFGRQVEPEEMARMAGASAAETVTMDTYKIPNTGYYPWFDTAKMTAEVLRVELTDPTNDEFRATRLFVRDLLNGPFVYNAYLRAPGAGLRIFEQQVVHLRAAGIKLMRANCYRGAKFNGYITWAKFGYNGPIPEHVRQKLPAAWKSAQTVQDIIAFQDASGRRIGEAWWEKNGDSFDGTFDLTDGSISMAVFKDYLRRRRG
jgi:hypothetical protein